MEIGLVVLGLTLALGVVFMISHGKSNKEKYIIWGITMMLVIAPLFSWVVSILYGVYEGSRTNDGNVSTSVFNRACPSSYGNF